MSKNLTVAIALFFSVYGCAQQKTISKNNNSKLIIAAKEIIHSAKTCALITNDDEGRPRVRTMDPFPLEEDLTVWFGTNASSRKVNQIKKDNRVTLYYLDNDNTGYVMIYGTASIVNEISKKETYWKTKWKDFYPNFPEGYMLIKVEPQWLEVVSETRGILGDSLTWTPQKVIFKN